MTPHQHISLQAFSVLSSAHPKRKSSSPFQSTLVCPNCYQWLQPDNHRMRLRPKPRPSAKVQSVLRRRARGKRLSLVQKNLLHRFQRSSSVLVRKTKCYYPIDLVVCCAALQNIVLSQTPTPELYC